MIKRTIKRKLKRQLRKAPLLLFIPALLLGGYAVFNNSKIETVKPEVSKPEVVQKLANYVLPSEDVAPTQIPVQNNITVQNQPAYTSASQVVNGNIPGFTESDMSISPGIYLSPLDGLGRCETAYAMLGPETLSNQERGSIGHIKPTGWNQEKYPGIVDSEPPYLYNRCHLIAYCLSGGALEIAEEKNLITGTRYMNVEGMEPYELEVLNYIRNTQNHVLYRTTPVFKDSNLLANGVIIEALSVEDQGSGICFNVYCPNIQPGITLDYATGRSSVE